MTNYVQEGKVITVTAAAPVASGDVVVVSDMVGVAANAADTGEEVEIAVQGVYTLPKDSAAEAIGQGDTVYATDEGKITTTATDNTACGKAAYASGAGTATVKVRLSN